MCADFLQQSHRYRLDYSTRDGIHIMRYALKLEQEMGHNLKEAFDHAVTQVLGEGADDMETRARGTLIDDNMVSFESFFGSIGDPGEVPGGERPEEADDDEDDA